LYGTVEIGGTKTDVAVGTSPSDLSEPHRIETGAPDVTLSAVATYLHDHDLDAIGIASFGPLDVNPASVRYGEMQATPKPGWSGVDVLGGITAGRSTPTVIDTDVNGAALGEGRWGAALGMSNFVYVTVGTGIGAGIVVGGRLVGGKRHPEAGHIVVRPEDGDEFEGTCPYHGDCLEGMTAGPALEARFGRPGTWAGNQAVLDLATGYVAQLVRDLVYTVAPERIIVGGGVSKLPGFHDRLREVAPSLLGDYPVETDPGLLVSPPGLGDLSGLAGGLAMAERAIG
jgi:fructokinase